MRKRNLIANLSWDRFLGTLTFRYREVLYYLNPERPEPLPDRLAVSGNSLKKVREVKVKGGSEQSCCLIDPDL